MKIYMFSTIIHGNLMLVHVVSRGYPTLEELKTAVKKYKELSPSKIARHHFNILHDKLEGLTDLGMLEDDGSTEIAMGDEYLYCKLLKHYNTVTGGMEEVVK